MVHFNHCLIFVIYFICIQQIICLPPQSSQANNNKYTISGPQLYPETEMRTTADVDYSKTADMSNLSDGFNADIQDSKSTGTDINGQFWEQQWPQMKRSDRQSRDLGRFGRQKYAGNARYLKYSPLKRKLKAGEIVKLLERIAERRGIQVSNKALRYGISRRSVD